MAQGWHINRMGSSMRRKTGKYRSGSRTLPSKYVELVCVLKYINVINDLVARQ